MDYLIVLFAGIAIGWLVHSGSIKSKQEVDIQFAIDAEAWRRQAEGLNRKGDLFTETDPVMDGVGYDIRKKFKLPANSNPTPQQLKLVKLPPPPCPPPPRCVKGNTPKPIHTSHSYKG